MFLFPISVSRLNRIMFKFSAKFPFFLNEGSSVISSGLRDQARCPLSLAFNIYWNCLYAHVFIFSNKLTYIDILEISVISLK